MIKVPTLTDQHTLAKADAETHILIVDDEQLMCDICSRALESSPYKVTSTTDVHVALRKLCDDQPFDLLIADIQMPHMNGLELAQHAREIHPSIVIIIITGHASIENLQQAVRSGIADFLTKPFEIDELRLAIDQALSKRRLLQDSIRLRAIEQLLASSEAINATLDCAVLNRIILQHAIAHVPCTAGFLFLSNQQCAPHNLLALPDGWSLLEAGRAAINLTYRDGVTRLIDQQNILCKNGEQCIRRGIAVAIRAQGEVIGILLLCDNQAAIDQPGVQETITLLSNYAGTALRNAHFYSQLQQTYHDLQELDRLKSEFIAIASHELRTPLAIVLGYATMFYDQSSGAQRAYVQRLVESAQRIKNIVDDMVSLRHMELRETNVYIENVSLQSLVDFVVELITPAAQQKNQHLIIQIPDPTVMLTTDREKVVLILGNLLSNAIKFTPEHGTIEVSAGIWAHRWRADLPHAPLSYINGEWIRQHAADASLDDDDTAWVVFHVRDNGIGIPKQEQGRIFERFYQVADSLTREYGGTGLGLAIARDLINLLGGLIVVESAIHHGSTFSFALPYYKGEGGPSDPYSDVVYE